MKFPIHTGLAWVPKASHCKRELVPSSGTCIGYILIFKSIELLVKEFVKASTATLLTYDAKWL